MASVCSDRTDMRKQLANALTGFAKPPERMLWSKALELLLVLQLSNGLAFGVRLGHRLPVHFGQLRFVVQCLQMGRTAGHTQMDDPFRLRGEVKRIDHAGPLLDLNAIGSSESRLQYGYKHCTAQPGGRMTQKCPAFEILN